MIKIKPNEQKILNMLKGMDPKLAYAKYISLKMKSPYNYTLQTLHGMLDKQWIKRHYNKNLNKYFYSLTVKAPIG